MKRIFSLRSNSGPKWQFVEMTLEEAQTALCDPSSGREVDGATHFGKRRVIVNADVPQWRKEVVVIHELLHVVLDDCGLGWLSHKREEAIVTYLAPRLLAAIEQMGYKLRW